MSPLRGIALKLLSVALFSVMAVLVKASMAYVPAGQAVFFRSFFALPVIMVWLLWRGDLSSGLKTARPMLHVWRGIIGVSAMGCGFAALGLLPLPEVTALGYAAPLLTVVFAAILLGERIRLFRIGAVVLGLVGVLIVLWPRLSLESVDQAARLGVVLILLSAMFRAITQIHVRRMVATEDTAAIVFYFSLTATLFSLLTVQFGWVWPPVPVLAMLVVSGLVGGAAQIVLTTAYRFSEAAVLAPFEYASILFAILFGAFLFDEAPTIPVLLGSAIVVAAGLLVIWRERQLGLKRTGARKGITPHG